MNLAIWWRQKENIRDNITPSIQDEIQCWLVMSAKQCQYPCSGPAMDSMNHGKCILNFPLSWLANPQWPFLLGQHAAYSNADIPVGAENKDFSAVSQMDLTRSLVFNKNLSFVCCSGYVTPSLNKRTKWHQQYILHVTTCKTDNNDNI